MATKRRIEITVETEQVTVMREEMNISTWCDDCQNHVLMIGLGQAAGLSGLSWREMVRKTDADELHCCEPPDGRLLICLASLAQWLRRSEQPALLLPPISLNLLETK